ncbi:hypothetical protein F5144DRAFT_87564 [Chaetomium tenue]|uniref:Uncharacterized protein n=1 Tax=Chaetomium tenue TaxID=1854479 RepID=A0ACB7PEW1_9PEZI|nr:hypothetical protein F5144DRAFT_87564 [Chaetomium globosum]
MLKTSLYSFAWLATLASAAGSPSPAAGIEQRALTTATVVEWTTTTATVNPSDPTVWVTLATTWTWPSTTTTTKTTGCVTVSYIYPPEDPTPTPSTTSGDATTTTVLRTVTSKTTVTETRTDVPLTTRYSGTVAMVSMTTDLTEYSTKCTNTAVLSFYIGATYTSTYTQAPTRTRITETEVCMATTTRWLPQTSVTLLPSFTTPYWDPDYYTDGTIVTVTEPLSRTSYVTVTTDAVTSTSVICDNPSTVITSTYFTITRTGATTTVQPTSCDSASEPPTTPTETPAAPAGLRRRDIRLNHAGVAGGDVRRRAEEPVGTRTVLFTTTGVLTNGTTATVTLTGIAETYTQTLTTIVMVGKTISATATKYLSECSSAVATSS